MAGDREAALVSRVAAHPYNKVMARLMRATPVLLVSLTITASGSVAIPGTALAKGSGKGTVAPPGNSGVSQYVEDVPTAKGGKPTSSIVIAPKGGGGPGSGGTAGGSGSTAGGSGGLGNGGTADTGSPATLSGSVTRQLDHSGKAGKSAVALAQATAPVVSRKRHAASKPPTGATTAVVKSLEGSAGGGGMGALLPIFLIASLVLLSALGIFTRRRTT